jgi:2-oxoglutarate/2-oxoacid ferredoxin oxidoreductase subunit alpha
MKRDVFTYLIGGQAGQGVKKAGVAAADMFARMGRHVFQMNDYPSLITGGHNFAVVSTALREVTSHYMKADLVVALDDRSYQKHKGNVADGGVMVFNSDETKSGEGIGIPMTTIAKEYPEPMLRVGVTGLASLCAAIGMSRGDFTKLIEKEYKRELADNVAFGTSVYEAVREKLGEAFELERGKTPRRAFTGNQSISLGAAAAGLDMYFAYPMTPATSILHFFAAHSKDLGVVAVQPESEIAVANMAIGAAAAGSRTMVGTSGGGFALMEEAFSFAGMAEVPFLCVMGSRGGPSTGIPTYTEQGDLDFALNQGHGDFVRIVASPGSMSEAFSVAAELLSLVWEYQTTGVLLTEKHLEESRMTAAFDTANAFWPHPVMHQGGDYKRYLQTETGVSPMLFPPSKELINWNSYEHDELGITTEEGPLIARMHEKRCRKVDALRARLRTMRAVNHYGDKGPLIITYGSTTLSVREALLAGGIEARVAQPVYLEPFPDWEFEGLKDERAIVIEQSCSGQFARLIREKTGIQPREVIKRYDGRPFEPKELAERISALVPEVSRAARS